MDNVQTHEKNNNAATVKPLAAKPDATLAVPGSKSLANRAILLAAAAEGESSLTSVPASDDIRAALSALKNLGIRHDFSGGILTVRGCGLDFPVKGGSVYIGSSGTVGRFLPGILAAAPAGEWLLESTEQLARRPLANLLNALSSLGARLEQLDPALSFPLRVRAGGLSGKSVAVSAAKSSQFASGVLLASPLADFPVEVVITDLDPDEAYIAMTLDLMREFGVACGVMAAGGVTKVAVPAPQRYRAVRMAIEADFNSALYFLSLPLLVGGSVTVSNLGNGSGQPGLKFLEVLARLGGDVDATASGITVRRRDRMPLRGGFNLDMRAMSEMALTLGVLAVFADAPITMTNLAHIRGHETDRLAALGKLLGSVNVRTEMGDDWIRIHPQEREDIPFATIDSMDDHRLVMSFSLLGLAANGLAITNYRAVDKTFPEYFDYLKTLGADVSFNS
jgi:3-phosphoshikimate 1-carboxyvinyltransferase